MIGYNIAGLVAPMSTSSWIWPPHPEFVAGNVDTEFIPLHYDQV
jgi:hypothetical protein